MTIENTLLQLIADKIRGTDFEGQVFVAGGFVRDKLLGKDSKDIDLVVTRDGGGIEFANWITSVLGCRTDSNPVIFPRFGTAKFNIRRTVNGTFLGDVDIEAVMPRSEKYTMGDRRPDVGFASLEEDAQRRDFTVNSLFLNITNDEIVDFNGGKQDIYDGLIRTAIDPDIIFRDDPLRMLRAIRMAARFNWTIDPILLAAIKNNAALINTISQERIADEMRKMMLT